MQLIVVIVERGKADDLVKIARESGAFGATIFYARGSTTSEIRRLFKVEVDAMKEVILIVIDDDKAKQVLKAISDAARLGTKGAGIGFTIKIENVVGMDVEKFNSEED